MGNGACFFLLICGLLGIAGSPTPAAAVSVQEVIDHTGPPDPVGRIREKAAYDRVRDIVLGYQIQIGNFIRTGRPCYIARGYVCIDPADSPCAGEEVCPSRDHVETLLELLRREASDSSDLFWSVGPAVAGHVLAEEYGMAMDLARACRANPHDCAWLEGFVHAAQGRMRLAEIAFDRGLDGPNEPVAYAPPRTEMGDSLLALDQCRRAEGNLEEVIDPRLRPEFVGADCGERDRIARTAWWLADPLFLVPGNERRAEHFFRQTYLWLHAVSPEPTEYYERFDHTRRRTPRTADPYCYVCESHNPAYHREVIRFGRLWHEIPASLVRITTRDYVKGRYSFMPSASAVRDPLHSTPEDYELNRSPAWEGYTPIHRTYVALPHQIAVFDRSDSIEVVAASEPPIHQMSFFEGRVFGLALAAHPEEEPWIERRTGHEERYLFRVMHPRRRYLASVEMISPAPGAARARRGIGLPEGPDQRLHASDLLLFEPGDEVPVNLDEAAELMYPKTLVPLGSRLGIFWETYGLDEGEEVQVRLQLERERGALGRVGEALGVLRQEATIAWEDPVGGGESRIWPRSVILGLTGSEPGDYLLRLTLTTAGQEPFEVIRELTIG